MSRDAQRSGGARGGRAEFSWDKVAAGDASLNYIGASVKTQVGRFQKDAQWYVSKEAAAEKDGAEEQNARPSAAAAASGSSAPPRQSWPR